MKREMIRILVALALVLSLATAATADTVVYNGATYDPFRSVTWSGAPSAGTHSAGQFDITWNGVNTWAYCVDLSNTISQGTYDATASPITSGYFAAAYLLDLYRLDADNNTKSAALQAAIWKAVYPTFTLSASTANDIESFYNTYIQSIDDVPGNYTGANYTYLNLYNVGSNTVRQGLITGVPEPMTMLLLGLGLVGLAGLRRKE